MSGTSLDGLDIALCKFKHTQNTYEYSIIDAETIEYSPELKERLSNAFDSHARDFQELNSYYGRFVAEKVTNFLSKRQLSAELIASHGHTVFHQPQHGFSTQIGCGATIAAQTGITTVCDFRSMDVALNGQGAPLVPIGDKLLFNEFTACLNLGGIANISFDDHNRKRIAFDVSVCNIPLNYFAAVLHKPYDEGGHIARSGQINSKLLKALDTLDYYSKQGSKSLGIEWFQNVFLKAIHPFKDLRTEDLLRTITEHIASQIAATLNTHRIDKVLVTGGGAYNSFLIEQIQSRTSAVLSIPDKRIVDFKEALIFAFLGYLRVQQKTNTLCTVTGAKRNSIGGAVYLGHVV